MRVIYGSELDITVADSLSADDILATLKDTYTELNNATYNIATEGGERVMRITLRTGSKA